LENVTTGEVGALTEELLALDCDVRRVVTEPKHCGYWMNSRKRAYHIGEKLLKALPDVSLAAEDAWWCVDET
ncbi:unnamed protein product, partial [Durusdinium trenchii]